MSKIHAAFMSYDTKYEVQRTNNFRFVIDMSELVDGTSVSSGEFIELACDTAGLPTVSNDPIELDYGNSNVKVAGKATVDDVSVAVKDFIEPNIEGILWKWRCKVYNPATGKVGWAKNYKKAAKIIEYGPNGECKREWVLDGVWPTSLDLGDLDYSSGDKKQITMNLSVDNAYLETTSPFATNNVIGTEGDYMG